MAHMFGKGNTHNLYRDILFIPFKELKEQSNLTKVPVFSLRMEEEEDKTLCIYILQTSTTKHQTIKPEHVKVSD